MAIVGLVFSKIDYVCSGENPQVLLDWSWNLLSSLETLRWEAARFWSVPPFWLLFLSIWSARSIDVNGTGP